MKKCIVMFSGGLDSVCAAHLLKEQGFDVTLLHFVLPFASGLGLQFIDLKKSAKFLGLPLRIEEEGAEFLAMLRDPAFGFGKNVNPCIDCRIYRLMKAKVIMDEVGAAFIATGEVLGQRPMSQRKHSMEIIEKKAELDGILLRPLCALVMKPTELEISGLVDRNKLLGFNGRTRKPQLAYARKYGLIHDTPGGGCLLTEPETAIRYNDLLAHNAQFSIDEFKLIAYGRHFRISDTALFIIGRDATENDLLEKLVVNGYYTVQLAHEIPGPFGIGCGIFNKESIRLAASMIVRYSKLRNKKNVDVIIEHDSTQNIIAISPIMPDECECFRVGSY